MDFDICAADLHSLGNVIGSCASAHPELTPRTSIPVIDASLVDCRVRGLYFMVETVRPLFQYWSNTWCSCKPLYTLCVLAYWIQFIQYAGQFFLIHLRTCHFYRYPSTAFSALRVFAITAGNRKLSLLVFILGLVPVATNIVRILLYSSLAWCWQILLTILQYRTTRTKLGVNCSPEVNIPEGEVHMYGTENSW